MTDEERAICKIYLEDIDKHHACNEYKLLMQMLDEDSSLKNQDKDVSREFIEIVVEYPKICSYKEYEGKPYFCIKYLKNGTDEFIGYGTYKPEVLSQYIRDYFISITPKSDDDLRESIAKAVDDKMDYLYTCPNERDIILGIIRGKRYDTESHCGRDCNNTDCKSHPDYKPKEGHCKDCKWWKDSDGLYRRGSHAESQCPINRREVFEGNGYCYMYEPQKRSE